MRPASGSAARSSPGVELRGRTLGIVGLGKIGQAIADRARAMEMTVIGQDPFVTAEQAATTASSWSSSTSCCAAPTS